MSKGIFNHLCMIDQDPVSITPDEADMEATNVRVYTNRTGGVCVLFDLQGKQELIEIPDGAIEKLPFNSDEFTKLYKNTAWMIKLELGKMTQDITGTAVLLTHLITERIVESTSEQYRSSIIRYLDKSILPTLVTGWTKQYYGS